MAPGVSASKFWCGCVPRVRVTMPTARYGDPVGTKRITSPSLALRASACESYHKVLGFVFTFSREIYDHRAAGALRGRPGACRTASRADEGKEKAKRGNEKSRSRPHRGRRSRG